MFSFFSKTPLPDIFKPLTEEAMLSKALDHSHSEPVVFFKHSSRCALSSMVRRQMLDLSTEADPPVYELVVQEARALSRHLAERFQITHHSPQAIVVYKAEPIFNTSHSRITTEAIREAVKLAYGPQTHQP